MGDVRSIARLDAFYARLPTLDCKRECESSCGPIAMTRVEWHRIIRSLGYEPRATSINCPMLRDGLCSVYAIRPTICRIWGLTEQMACPWGCAPSRYLTYEEGHLALMEAEYLSEGLSDDDIAAELSRFAQLMADNPDRVALSKAMLIPPVKTNPRARLSDA